MSEVLTRLHKDESAGLVYAERIQDVEAIIERNKALQTDRQKAETFHHVGTIPNVILEKWINDDGVNYLALPGEEFARLVFKKLRDPDWAFLRTTDRRF